MQRFSIEVVYWFVFVENVDDVGMQVLLCNIAREATHVVNRIADGTEVEEDACAVGTSFLCCNKQRRLTVYVLCVAVGSTHEENAHCFAIVDRNCPVKCCLSWTKVQAFTTMNLISKGF